MGLWVFCCSSCVLGELHILYTDPEFNVIETRRETWKGEADQENVNGATEKLPEDLFMARDKRTGS